MPGIIGAMVLVDAERQSPKEWRSRENTIRTAYAVTPETRRPSLGIDLSSLSKAITQAEGALAYAGSPLAESDPELRLHLRAAAIQAFEFTYELTVKVLRRHLADTDPSSSNIAGLDFAGLVRTGFMRGLLREEVGAWRGFRNDRNATSHAYDHAKAEMVFRGIPRFLDEARFLRDRVRDRQEGE